jgi:hypothetical protein
MKEGLQVLTRETCWHRSTLGALHHPHLEGVLTLTLVRLKMGLPM